ncbi:TPA: hypothetical protein L7363_004316 [Escherichia coli]|nr:hypothetical protein [Escherichia coli]
MSGGKLDIKIDLSAYTAPRQSARLTTAQNQQITQEIIRTVSVVFMAATLSAENNVCRRQGAIRFPVLPEHMLILSILVSITTP